jgi:hypothetical protein
MIDFHTHPVLIREFVEKFPDYAQSARTIFNIGNNFQPLETFLLQMDVARVDRAVLLPIDCSRARGLAVSTGGIAGQHADRGASAPSVSS